MIFSVSDYVMYHGNISNQKLSCMVGLTQALPNYCDDTFYFNTSIATIIAQPYSINLHTLRIYGYILI